VSIKTLLLVIEHLAVPFRVSLQRMHFWKEQEVMDNRSKSVSVAICIVTYKRPMGLQRLLSSLRELKFYKGNFPDLRIIIVDNDSSTPVNDLVDGLAKHYPIPVRYEIEPKRGIASARNRAVKLAGDVDFIAFIDDDEVADCCWLDELINVQDKLGADVVNGPVLPRFEQPVPAWVLKGRFYNRRRFTTGTKINWANTGNVLIKTSWMHAIPGPFNEKLNLSGGSDTLFFSQVCRLGAKMVWSDEAIVEEYNPPSRVSANWILRRAYRLGINTSIIEIRVGSSSIIKIIRMVKSGMHIVLGLLLLIPASIFSGYAGFIRSLIYINLGRGEICGILGISYMEYEHTHGN
jgi:succinoglycan biosynthesis protein ExoM